MVTPFTKPIEAPATELAKTNRLFRGGIMEMKSAVNASHKKLIAAETKVLEATSAGTLNEGAAVEEFGTVARQFNNEVKGLKFAHGKLGASVEGMFKSFADTLGINTTKWTSNKIKGSANEAFGRAAKVEGNIIERLVSKPFRMAANNPKIAMVTGGLLAVAGIGSVVKKRAARRTEENAQQQAAMIEAQMQQQPMAQATTTYMPAPAADMSFPAQGSPMNMASPQLMAGNDNAVEHQGMVNSQQRAAAL